MKPRIRRRLIVPLFLLMIGLILIAPVQKSSASGPSEQVIFSGVGFAGNGDWQGPVGFWIWCQPEGTGPYGQHDVCAGAMYVYSQAITVYVDGQITENPDDTYTMTVSSRKPGVLSATLHNATEDLENGPNNIVDFSVTTAAGTSLGESDTAVVNVTGPGD
jgi:hypothetical protein